MREKLFSVEIKSLTRGGKSILNDITFSVAHGTITAILGVNGAGKTSLIKAILSVIDKEKSSTENNRAIKVMFGGNDLSILDSRAFTSIISHLGSSDLSKPLISVAQFLAFAFKDKISLESKDSCIKDSLNFWRLQEKVDCLVCNLSEGEFQRLLLATIFLQEAEIYLLDEPERHLDPEGLSLLEAMCVKKREEKKIVIFSSHDLISSFRVSDFILGLTSKGEQRMFLPVEDVSKSGIEEGGSKELDALYGVEFSFIKSPSGRMVPLFSSILKD